MIYEKAHVDVIRTYSGGKWVKVANEKGDVERVRSVNVITEEQFEAIQMAEAMEEEM